MSRTDPQMNFRIPAELKPRLVEAARKNGRTVNAELVYRLERSFDEPARPLLPDETIKAILETRQMVHAIHAAVKTPSPGKPFQFGKKSKSKLDGNE